MEEAMGRKHTGERRHRKRSKWETGREKIKGERQKENDKFSIGLFLLQILTGEWKERRKSETSR